MYEAFFGLADAPFRLTPDPRYLYMSDRHREGLAHLLYGIGEGGGFVQLTGEVGTGKTTLCRCLLEQLPPEVDVALILNPKLTDVELLAAVCDELRIAYPAGTTSRKLLIDGLYQHLLDAHGRGRRTVLIIDEAQDLAPEVLEQVLGRSWAQLYGGEAPREDRESTGRRPLEIVACAGCCAPLWSPSASAQVGSWIDAALSISP